MSTCLYIYRPVIRQERDAWLGGDNRELACVVKVLGRGAIHDTSFLDGRKNLMDDVTDMRIGLLVGFALRPHTNFGTAVAAKNGSVLNQRDVEPLPVLPTGQWSRASQSAADDDQIETAPVRRVIRQPQQLPAKLRQRGPITGGLEVDILAKQDRFTAAFKASQVVQGNGGVFTDFDGAAVLPVPFAALGSRSSRQGASHRGSAETFPEHRVPSRVRPNRVCGPTPGRFPPRGKQPL